MFDIDASGNLVFIYHYQNASMIYKFRLNGMSCPNNNYSYTVNLKDKIRLDGSRSMVAHPTNDKIIYLLRSHEVQKITLGTRDSTNMQKADTRAGLKWWAEYKPPLYGLTMLVKSK